ncbi:MAG TPA: methylated-DNA--[protein]-cysteine S-methyltransferase [Solirubrobacteraceae bacterium]
MTGLDEARRALLARAAEEELIDVAYAGVDSPVGRLLAASTREGLVTLSYPENEPDAVLERLAAQVSPRVLEAPARLDTVRRELDEYFAGRRTAFDLPLDLRLAGDGFGRRVLEQTAAIPFGAVLTYGEVAGRAGSPRAFRAAGNALGANPIPIVVPCHRIVAAGGRLGGYTGGLERKRALLGLERVEVGA